MDKCIADFCSSLIATVSEVPLPRMVPVPMATVLSVHWCSDKLPHEKEFTKIQNNPECFHLLVSLMNHGPQIYQSKAEKSN